jgi:hypothetical protein
MAVQASNIISVPADYFVARIAESVKNGEYYFCGSDMDVAAIEVTGGVDLTDFADTEFAKAFCIENVYFRDALRMDNCKFSNSVSLKSCAFDRSINLGKTVFRNGLSLTDCRFGIADTNLDGAALVLDDANIRGDVVFDRVSVHGCILARRLRLVGDLKFTACTVDGISSDANAAPLDMSNSRIRGSIVFETGRMPAAMEHSLAETLGKPVSRRPRLQRSFFRDRRKGGTCVLLRGAEVTELVRLAWARFAGELDLAFIKCRVLNSEAGFFARRLDEPAPGNVSQKTIAPNEGFGGARIEGPVTLSGGEFGLIHLYGVSISGEMMLVAGRSGQINIEDSISEGVENERFVATSRLGNFIMSRWRCRDFLYLHAAEITGKTNPSRVRGVVIISSVIDRGVSFWPGWTLQKALQGYLEPGTDEKTPPKFIATRPDGSLMDEESDPTFCNLLNRWRRRLAICGNISIDHCSIGDDIQLTGVDLIATSVPADGRIEIIDTKIDGNVVFRSPVSFIVDAQVEAPLLRLLAERFVVADFINGSQQGEVQAGSFAEHNARSQGVSFVPAFCNALNTSGLQADKIDLTGLRVQKRLSRSAGNTTNAVSNPPADPSSVNSSNAVMVNLKISGKIVTFARISKDESLRIFNKIAKLVSLPANEEIQKPKFELRPKSVDWERQLLIICFGVLAPSIRKPEKHLSASAEISGSLDFQHSQIEELLISDESFREHSPDSKATVSGIVLDHAQISKLYVARRDLQEVAARHHNGFPVPVSLLDVSVKTWFLEDEGAPGSLNTAYIDEETATADPYLDLLDNDPELRMSSYLAIGKSLRDRGLSKEAKQIFIAGTYRDVRTEGPRNRSIHVKARKNWWSELTAFRSAFWPRLKSGTWRRGDGRYRKAVASNSVLAFLLCLMLVAGAAYPSIGYMTKNPLVCLAYISLLLFVLFLLRGNIFRLRRPWLEYVGFVVCTLWCAVAACFLYVVTGFLTRSSQFGYEFLSAGIVFLLVSGVALSSTMRRFIDQLYWTLVDYGTSALRLAAIIFVLMFMSFALVSGERENFMPTLLAKLELQSHNADVSIGGNTNINYRPAYPAGAERPKSTWDDRGIPSKESWVVGERLWMTLRYHVPLVGAVISEEWQPSDRPLTMTGMTTPPGRVVPDLWPFDDAYWLRARDWYGIMLWLNWILWPLFLPFLIHTLSRDQ